jgi:hypothetical protein
MPFFEHEMEDELIEWVGKFTCNEGQLISRVPVGKFREEEVGNERSVFIEVYKVSDGYVLRNEWEFITVNARTPEQVQQIIEDMQDIWLVLAAQFHNESVVSKL